MQKTSENKNGFTLIEVIVALSLLSLSVAGFSQLRHSALRHVAITQEIQQASYFANSHINELTISGEQQDSIQSGEYIRGQGLDGYPWRLRLLPLSSHVFEPESTSLTEKVRPVQAQLSVWVDNKKRELQFHSLLLLEPVDDASSTASPVRLLSNK